MVGMSAGNKSLAAAYICFVGIPMLGLIGIMETGRNLHAPIAVGGAWDMQADLGSLVLLPCAASVTSSQQRVLIVTQSGKFLVLTMDFLQGSGTIENTTLTAGELRPVNGVACGGREVSFYLQASVERQTGEDLMNGVLTVNGCPSCAAVPFRAIRRHQAKVGR